MIDQYLDIRKHSEEICAPLKTEDYNAQVALHASPAAWQLGHTTWFFECMSSNQSGLGTVKVKS